jgi:hypothetical protein
VNHGYKTLEGYKQTTRCADENSRVLINEQEQINITALCVMKVPAGSIIASVPVLTSLSPA